MRARVLRVASLVVAMALVATCASRADEGSRPEEPARVSYVYDGAGRLVGVADATGEVVVYRYDAAGNIVGIERPAGGLPDTIQQRSLMLLAKRPEGP